MNQSFKSAIATLIVCAPIVAANAECSARGQPVANAMITHHGLMKVGFDVLGEGCNENCTGLVSYRVSYLTTRGESKTETATVVWTASDAESTRVHVASYRDSCNNAGFGPCEIKKVEVMDVTCSQLSDKEKRRLVRNDESDSSQ